MHVLNEDSRRISVLGGLILAFLTLVTGVSVYSVMQRQAESMLTDNLRSSLQQSVHLLQTQVKHRADNIRVISLQPVVIRALVQLNADSNHKQALKQLREVSAAYTLSDITALIIHDAAGNELVSTGEFLNQPDQRVTLMAGDAGSLLWWQDSFYLQLEIKAFDAQAHAIGRILAQVRLPSLTQAVSEVTSMRQTSEIGICTKLSDKRHNMQCFHHRASMMAYQGQHARIEGGVARPMSHALNGETGLMFTRDYRGEEVVAVYAPVAELGLGMVLKINQSELYGTVNDNFKLISTLLFALVIGGALLLRLLVVPLIRRLVVSEQETRTADALLSQAEERWRFAIEGSGDGVWDWDIPSNEVKLSRRWKEMLGYSEDEIEGRFEEWRQRLHPDDVDTAIAEVEANLDGSKDAYFNEHRLRCKDGSWKWMLARGMVVSHDENGRPLRMIGTMTDISARKQNETELREQRDFTNAVVEVAGNIIVVLDLDGCFVYFNTAAERLTGYSREELLGKPVWDWVIPQEQREGVENVFRSLKAGREDIAGRYENDWQARDGSRRTLDWRNTILHDEQGEITHIVALGYDLTERKVSEEKIQRLTRLYSSLSKCDHDIVHSVSQQELFPKICRDAVDTGGFAMAWVGLLEGDSYTVKPAAFYGEHAEYLEEIRITVSADEDSGQGPTGTAIRENRPVWCTDFVDNHSTAPWRERGEQAGWRSSAALPLLANGVVIGAINFYSYDAGAFDEDARELLRQIASDVSFALDKFSHESRRQQAERELGELNASLESRIRQRTEELDRARQVAEKANRSKGEFLANMSHEIRTPMNSIIGMSHLALKTRLDAQQFDYLKKIDYSAQHLLSLINNMLDFSKIEAGKLELEVLDFEIKPLLDKIYNQLVANATDKGLEFELDIDPGVEGVLRGDPLRLTQILLNYINNAIKFTERGGIIVRARVVEQSEHGRLLRFEVEDTGIGMNDEQLGQLFQLFQQADSSTTRKYGGTGLGLAISKQLAELMGGQVGASSQHGNGSLFWFTAWLQHGDSAIIDEESDLPGLEFMQGKTIMLVEDNAFNQQVGKELLEGLGAMVCIANNGQEAIDLLPAHDFDCVLMDVQMPVMDGLDATREIRARPEPEDVLIIAMTANVGEEYRQKCIDAGMNDFITKPIQPRLLYATLAKWLSPGSLQLMQSRQETLHTSEKKQLAGDNEIDLEVLKRILGTGDAAIVHRQARNFVQSAELDLDEMNQALKRTDMTALVELGHRSKSAAKAMGAIAYADLCESLEQCKRGEDLMHARAVVEQMREMLPRIAQKIERLASDQ